MLVSRIVLVLLGALGLVLGGSACGGSANAERTVVGSFYPLAFILEELAPDGVVVRNLTPAGAEPHDLELSTGDLRELRSAELAVYIGGGFQPSVAEALRDVEGGAALDVLGFAAPLRPGDPHVWLDPRRLAAVVDAVASSLEVDGAPLAERLLELDRQLEQGLARCARTSFVTTHAAFGYLADRYGIEQIALTGVEPEAEPSARELAALVERVRSSGATTVFFETLLAPDVARTVAREADVRTGVLNPLEGLTDEERAAGADYFTVMRDNLAALRAALGCR